MASILRALEADLRAISSEAKRRHQPVKEAADEALLVLKTAQSEGGSVADGAAATATPGALESAPDLVVALQAESAAVIPEALALAASSVHDAPKIPERAVGALHRLLSMGAVPPTCVPTVVTALGAQTSNSKDHGVVLKCVQSLLALLTNPPQAREGQQQMSPDQLFLEPLDLLLSIYGSAADSSPPSAGAILDQTIELAFRQVAAQLFTTTSPTTLEVTELVFRDICSVAARDPPRKLQNLGLRRTVALEILEELLTSSDQETAPRIEVIQAELCPALHKLLKEGNRDDRVRFLKVHRLLLALVSTRAAQLPAETEAYLVTLLRGLRALGNTDDPEWLKTIPMETLRAIGARPSLVASLAKTLDHGASTTPVITRAIEIAVSHLGKPTEQLTLPVEHDLRNLTIALSGQASPHDVALRCMLTLLTSLDRYSMPFVKRSAWEQISSCLGQYPEIWVEQETSQKSIVMTTVAKALVELHMACETDQVENRLALTAGRSALIDAACQTADHFLQKDDTFTAAMVTCCVLCECVNKVSEGIEAPAWLGVLYVLQVMDQKLTSNADSTLVEQYRLPMEQVFGSADKLSSKACAELVSGLVNCSRTEITRGGGKSQSRNLRSSAQEKHTLFGIPRIRQTITLWLGRQDAASSEMPITVWELVAGHLVSVSTNAERADWRLTAVSVLVDLVSLALQEKVGLDSQRVLTPFTDVVAGNYTDARERALSGVHQVLESQGETIRGNASWVRIIEVLRAASGQGQSNTNSSVSLVAAGFKSVQLLGGDFLPLLTRTTTAEWIRTLGLYSKQVDDVNVALAAIGLFWRTADFMAVATERKEDSSMADEANAPEPSDLWLLLYEELKRLTSDERPEVRNVAIKTLTGALVSHGNLMDSASWELCLQNSLLPMLVNVVSMEAKTINNAGVERSAADGTSTDETTVQLHHSRDTPEKQWNESRVLAITGISRVVKGYAGRLFSLSRFHSVWVTLLETTVISASSEHREVSCAGVAALLNLLNAVGSQVGKSKKHGALVDEAWSEIWSSLNGFVSEDALRSGKHGSGLLTNEKATSSLAEGLVQVTQNLAGSISPQDSRNIIQLLRRIAVSSVCPGWRQSYKWPGATEVQISALHALENLQFGTEDKTWSTLIHSILEFIGSTSCPPALQKRAVSSIQTLFSSDRMPAHVQAFEIPVVLSKLTGPMLARGTWTAFESEKPQQAPLWALAVDSVLSCLSGGMGDLNGEIWSEVYVALEKFLFPDDPLSACFVDSSAVSCSAAKRDWCLMNERFDMKIATWISVSLSSARCSLAEYMVSRFIRLLEQGGKCGLLRIRFAHECQVQLFKLAAYTTDSKFSVASSSDRERRIGAISCKSIVNVADSVLLAYVKDDRRTGNCPLPFTRRAEAITLLRGLAEIWPESADSISADSVDGLYPRLCDCITSGDEIVRIHTRELISRRRVSI